MDADSESMATLHEVHDGSDPDEGRDDPTGLVVRDDEQNPSRQIRQGPALGDWVEGEHRVEGEQIEEAQDDANPPHLPVGAPDSP